MFVAALSGGVSSRLGGGKFANGASSAAFAALIRPGSKKPISQEVEVPEEIKRAVSKAFESSFNRDKLMDLNLNIDSVNVIENSRWANFVSGFTELVTLGNYYIAATTQKDTIYLSVHTSAAMFFSDHELVLHEYYHVLMQWNNNRMNNFSYLVNSTKLENEASNFAINNVNAFTR